MEGYNIKWYVSILSTKFGEWSIPTKVRPSSINKWYKDIITTTVVTTFWNYQDPTTTKITVQEFIKYLLDTWKTKQFVRDHRIFITPNSQHITLFFDLCQNVLITCPSWVFSLRSQQATSLWGRRHRGPGQDSSTHSLSKLRPWLGSNEGCSFICSSLWLRRKRTVRLGVHVRNLCPCEKLRARAVEEGEKRRNW